MNDSGSKRRLERPAQLEPYVDKRSRAKPLRPSSLPPSEWILHPPPLPACIKARPENEEERSDDIFKFFDITTHIIPAAYPRSAPLVPFSELERRAGGFPDSETKKSRTERSVSIAKHLMDVENEWSKGMLAADGSESRVLWNVVNRYSRKKSNVQNLSKVRLITLVLAHGNGLIKETWEPFLVHLCNKLQNHDVYVDEAWAIESVQHSDSYLINDNKIGVLFDWPDYSRDIINFVQNYLPDRSSSMRPLPAHLQPVSENLKQERTEHGFQDRTIVMVGNSVGGSASALAAVSYPNLFSSLILVDPMIVPGQSTEATMRQAMTLGIMSLQRQETWSSRHRAAQALKRSPVFGAWHPYALEKYVKYGLVQKEDHADHARVTLKEPGIQEAVIYIGYKFAYETFAAIGDLDDRVSLLWVLASGNEWLTREQEQLRVWSRPENCEHVSLTSGHLVVQEVPEQLAQEVSAFILSKFARTPLLISHKL